MDTRDNLGPIPVNEPVLSYAPGTAERDELASCLQALKAETVDIPLVIGGREIRTGDTYELRPPHERARLLGSCHRAGVDQVAEAIDSSVAARYDWSRMDFEKREAVFLKAADLLAGPWRQRLNAATMLGQSKNAYQADIDAACELIDFLRFNVHFARQLRQHELISPVGITNRMDYRPLEGFVFALPPFNFTSIICNLPTAPAIMGCGVVWKPASTAVYSAWVFQQLLQEAGLPDGVINFVPGSGAAVAPTVMASEHLAGLHFTGSAGVFQDLWRAVGQNIANYRAYPRVVGETGGKDFIVAHPSADPVAVATAIGRGAFEYQGQKCSAASRVYVPKSIWPEVKDRLLADVAAMGMGPVEDFGNFINAVIDEKAHAKIASYIEFARVDAEADILIGGNCSRTDGLFIEPTVVLTTNPKHRLMCEEIFGPVVTIYVYDDANFVEVLRLVDETSPFALTGAIFAEDREGVELALDVLRDAAGNFYINDKPTGAVVAQQPFGGGRASGTNDKAGSYLNLTRWISPRSIKENHNPAKDFRYPFMG